MIGIVLASHGETAAGMVDAARLIFGNEIDQIRYLSINNEVSLQEFVSELVEAIHYVDTGDGVVVLVDFFGGTPSNQSPNYIGDNVHVVTGMNMPLLLELISSRDIVGNVWDLDISDLIQTAKAGIVYLNEFLKQYSNSGFNEGDDD